MHVFSKTYWIPFAFHYKKCADNKITYSWHTKERRHSHHFWTRGAVPWEIWCIIPQGCKAHPTCSTCIYHYTIDGFEASKTPVLFIHIAAYWYIIFNYLKIIRSGYPRVARCKHVWRFMQLAATFVSVFIPIKAVRQHCSGAALARLIHHTNTQQQQQRHIQLSARANLWFFTFKTHLKQRSAHRPRPKMGRSAFGKVSAPTEGCRSWAEVRFIAQGVILHQLGSLSLEFSWYIHSQCSCTALLDYINRSQLDWVLLVVVYQGKERSWGKESMSG